MPTIKPFYAAFVALGLTVSVPAIATAMSNGDAEITTVGGAEMYPSKNIVENASKSEDHTTLVAAVKAANLVDTLSGDGPFTVFAPTNSAFDALPDGTVETLLKPENQDQLSSVLTYHVVPGKITAQDIASRADDEGKVELETVQGETITIHARDGSVAVMDASGNEAKVTQADVMQSNGVIHVIDTVILPQ